MRNLENICKKNDGFTLLELLLVVGVGAILLIAGVGTYQLISEGNKVNDAQRLLQTLKSKIQQEYQGQVQYGTAADNLTALVVAMDIVPNQYLRNGTQPIHPWNDTVDVAVSASPLNFTITYNNLPNSSCISMGTIDIDADPDFVSMDIGASTFTPGALPTPQAVDALCTGGATTISWTFF